MQWTPHAAPSLGVPYAAAGFPGGSRAEVAASRRKAKRLEAFARASLWVWAGLQIVALAVLVYTVHHALGSFRTFFNRLGEGTPGQPPPGLPVPGDIVWGDLTELLAGLSGVVFVVWQYHSACFARSIGYPARVQPGIGAASWVLPVVNFWLPHQAMSDLLPPRDPRRGRALRLWLLYVVGLPIVAYGAAISALSWWPIIPAVVIFVADVGVVRIALSGGRLIAAVGADHERAALALGLE